MDVQAGDTWYQATSPHFTVVGDGGEKPARMVAGELELFRSAFESVLRVRVESGRPLRVIAAKSEGSLRRLIPWFWERRGRARPDGFYISGEDEDWAVLRTDVAQPTSVIVHEYVHALLRLSLSGQPLWFEEGLSQLYGASRVEPDGISIGNLGSAWQVPVLRDATPLPVVDLMAVDGGSPDYTDRKRVGVFYAESLLVTHFFLFADDDSHRPALDRLLALLEEGTGVREALTRSFGGPEALDKALRAYLDRGQFPYAKATPSASAPPIGVRELRSAEAAVVLAEFARRTGRASAAQEGAAKALRSEPDLGSAHLLQGMLLYSSGGRGNEATAALADARRLSPENAVAQYRFGALGRGALADPCSREEALRAAARLAPTWASPHRALADLLIEAERPLEDALGEAREAVRLEPGSARFRITLLDLETRVGHAEAAALVEGELRRAARSNASVLAALLSYYESHWAPGKAEYLLREICDHNPRNVFATERLASLLKDQGWREEGEAILRRGLVAVPHAPGLLNDLAYSYAERDARLTEALASADEALTLRPEDPNFQDTKAWVLYRLGRYRDAEELARRSLETLDAPVVREHLGDILVREGRVESAVAEWRRVLSGDGLSDEKRHELDAKIRSAEAAANRVR